MRATLGNTATVLVGGNKLDLPTSHQRSSFIKSRLHIQSTKATRHTDIKAKYTGLKLTSSTLSKIDQELKQLLS